MKVRAAIALAVVLAAACGAGGPPPPQLPEAELKYRVMDAAGRIWFCDPDYFPIARADERDLARQRVPEIRKDAQLYAVITAHAGADDLAIYRDWKALSALQLQPINDAYAFAYLAQNSDKTGERVDGRVTKSGSVMILSRTAAGPPNCPICLARGTLIATPSGEVAVESLRVGGLVWTLDADGARIAARLAAVGSTAVPATHEVVRLSLSDGRVVLVSPGHPLTDGRAVGALRDGDAVDGAIVVATERLPYGGGATFDILPAGATGAYWANGVLLASTLR